MTLSDGPARRRRGVPAWLFVIVTVVAVALGGLLALSELGYAKSQDDLNAAVDTALGLADQLADYTDAVDECQETIVLWAKVSDTQDEIVDSFYSGLSTFFSSWNYRAGDPTVIYEGADRLRSERSTNLNNALNATCDHPDW